MIPNPYSYLIDDGDENKKAKDTKCVIKQNFKFKVYKNCLEAKKHDNEINFLGKYDTEVDNLRENHKEFVKSNKIILRSQQRFQSERNNLYTKEVNKIALCANDDKSIQSVDSIEICAYGTKKDILHKNKEIKYR